MGDFAYHQEVLRKARVIERKREAARATDIQFGEEFTNSVGTKSGKREQVAARYNDYSQDLDRFRLTQDGFKNRYRAKDVEYPHVDVIYKVMYPETDNSSYTCEETRTDRRMNVQMSKYHAHVQVDGINHPVPASPKSEAQETQQSATEKGNKTPSQTEKVKSPVTET
ncbi:uncharacterized protein LOC106180080 isoform X1 [Lingula anatina]|uniref:Uncharacterized protein LOC106180080 isoform X1 n=1 Tax=Lingula anatina TaxID=7574 RepID=A0A1S3KAY1_LINAN|nr:uncharacterized protein LOC106180080 isoform X1 [Lingula anatina]|eukprot:XP_013419411.1 uncharacterized protein LOC106180080 isoform X1 [Lingula anatina]